MLQATQDTLEVEEEGFLSFRMQACTKLQGHGEPNVIAAPAIL